MMKVRYKNLLKTEIKDIPNGRNLLIAIFSGLSIDVLFLMMGFSTILALICAFSFSLWMFYLSLDTNVKYDSLWLSSPLISLFIVEYIMGNITLFPLRIDFNDFQLILNLMWYVTVFGIILLLSGRKYLSGGITAFVFWIIGNLEIYVFRYRGRVIFPPDIYALQTAIEVARNYDFSPSSSQIIATLLLVLYIGSLIVFSKKIQQKEQIIKRKLAFASISLLYVSLFFFTPIIEIIGKDAILKTAMWSTRNNGVLLNFSIFLKYSKIDLPDTYNVDIVKKITEMIPESNNGNQSPNVIVIMNEAFSDLTVLGDLPMETDPLQYFNSLNENTIKGKLNVSVLGGHTASTEYEFLTGNSMAFLPKEMVAFQLYVKENDFSLFNQFKALGYHTAFLHPFVSTGWNRPTVYRNFGADDQLYFSDFEHDELMRIYVSDKSNYETLISYFEAHESDNPLFIFNVTMQNHGGYFNDFDIQKLQLYDEFKELFPNVEEYLALIRESDKALKTLVEYFDKIEEPTLILFFGDHQPNFDSSFYELIWNKPQNQFTLEEESLKYIVPFMIWANYDIEEKQDVELSANYLSALLSESARIPMTKYQTFLLRLHEQMPVISSIGMKERKGEFINQVSGLSKVAQVALEQYSVLQYNSIFDRENRVDKLFYLDQ